MHLFAVYYFPRVPKLPFFVCMACHGQQLHKCLVQDDLVHQCFTRWTFLKLSEHSCHKGELVAVSQS